MIMSPRAPVIVAVLAALAAGCASMPGQRCGRGEQTAVQELVYFGTQKPGGFVSAQDWAAFLADTVTPRFPAGLTAWQASGQWRSDAGGIVQEPSYVLNLLHPDDAATEQAVQELIDVYQQRFEQEAVLRVKSNVCASF